MKNSDAFHAEVKRQLLAACEAAGADLLKEASTGVWTFDSEEEHAYFWVEESGFGLTVLEGQSDFRLEGRLDKQNCPKTVQLWFEPPARQIKLSPTQKATLLEHARRYLCSE